MTAMPDPYHSEPTLVPYDLRRLYTVEEFAQLPEDNTYRYELQDGVITVSPRPTYDHQLVSGMLFVQIRPQLPRHLKVIQEIDIALDLSTETVRSPDLVIIRAEAARRRIVRSSDVLLAVEILSPGSIRTDTKIKPDEYDEAGIPNFWVIDPRPPTVTATVYGLYNRGFEESQRCEHSFQVDRPCPLTIDLDALLPD